LMAHTDAARDQAAGPYRPSTWRTHVGATLDALRASGAA
jgi:hypothetical protein